MIWIMADEVEAVMVATAAGLAPHQWKRLHWHQQIAGEDAPNVVVLASALYWERDVVHEIVEILLQQRGRRWSETDLMNRRIPL